MPIVDTRVKPLGELRLWSPGQADPIIKEREYATYTPLKDMFGRGVVSLSGGEPTLQYLEGVGMVCRPFLNLKDTRLSHYTVSGGSWEERQPSTGSPIRYRLVQYDNTAGVQWSATSAFSMPANPSVAFSLAFIDTPPDWDATALPPFIRIEFGKSAGFSQYALEFSKAYGARFLIWNASLSTWQAYSDLPEPQGAGNSDNEESLVVLRCHRGMIGVSMDRDRTYKWYDRRNVTVGAGSFTLRGQGGMGVFGLHQLEYREGSFTAPERDTGTPRGPFSYASVITGRGSVANGGTLTYTDLSPPSSRAVQWRATLTPPAPLAGTPFSFYYSPELYAVQFRYPARAEITSGASSVPYPDLLTASVSKGRELEDSRATITARLDASAAFTWLRGRWPKARLRLGSHDAAGAATWTTVFTGFVEEPDVVSEEYNTVTLTLELVNVSERFRQAKWCKYDAIPLGGNSLNTALDYILSTELGEAALNESYRVWDPRGDFFPIPAGLAEDPCEWCRIDEDKWTTMQRLARYAGQEIVPDDDGVLRMVSIDYVRPGAVRTLQAVPTSDLKKLIRRLRWGFSSHESATAILVDGTGEDGEALTRWAVDYDAETNPSSPRFTPFRMLAQETLSGTVSPGLLAARVQSLAKELFAQPVEPDVTIPVDLDVLRREQVQVTGFEHAGIASTDRWVVLTLEHRYTGNPSMIDCTTHAGLRFLG